MSVQTPTVLKTYFETGDRPTQAQFVDLIDSFINNTLLTVTGDMIYASVVNTPARLADVAVGSVLVSGGVGVAPFYSATPRVTTLGVGTAVLDEGAIAQVSGVKTGTQATTQQVFRVINTGNEFSKMVISDGVQFDAVFNMVNNAVETSARLQVHVGNAGDSPGGEGVSITGGGNVCMGTAVFGASAAKVLALTNGATEPTTSVDLVHVYGIDLSAGNAALAVYQEAAVRTGSVVVTHSIPVRWNGATYYLLASNV